MNGFGRDEGKEKKEKSRASVMTRETVGMTLLLFSAVVFFICVTGAYLFGEIGVAITAFFVGLCGFMAYPLLLFTVYESVVLVFGKGKIPWGWKLRVGFFLVSVFLIVHTATADFAFGTGYGEYLSDCWNAARVSAVNGTGGGVILGVIVYPVQAFLSSAGAYVVFAALTLLSVFLILLKTPLRDYVKGVHLKKRRAEKKSLSENAELLTGDDVPAVAASTFEDLTPPVRRMPPKAEPVRREQAQRSAQPNPNPAASRSYFSAQDPAVKSEKDRSREILFGSDPQEVYRKNLIFNHDSYFNSRERSSSMYDNLKRADADSYSARYSAAAEASQEPVPRRISGEKPASSGGYSYSPVNDVSYSQTPSYRAEPEKTESDEPRDYYGHDVPYNEEFSSLPEDGEPKSAFVPEPESTPAPAANEAPEEDIFTRMMRERQEQKRNEPAIDYNSGDSIRSLFSRSVGEDRTVLPRETDSDDGFRASRNDRGERTFSEPDGFGGRDEGEDRTFRDDRAVSREEDRFFRDDRAVSREEDRTFRDDRAVSREEGRTFRDDRAVSREEDRTFRDGGFEREERRSAADLFDDDADEGDFRREETPPPPAPRRESAASMLARRQPEERIAPTSTDAAPAPEPKRHVYRQYVAPDYSLFNDYNDAVAVPQEEIERNSAAIEECLMGFRVDAKVVKVTCGATVTRYDLEIPGNISVNTVIKRDEEIAMRLHASDGVNMYANRANGTVSVDVPNSTTATVGLRPLLYANEYVNSKPGSLMFVIGKDVEGKPVIGNIVKMKQLLVAGTTGSGKSVCLHTMLISLICKYSPEDLRLILIDPKGEFTIYEGLPHLMINEIISDAQKAVTALNWAIKEMERRYALFQQKTRSGVLARNVDEYNGNLTPDEQKLCKIVIVVDELADLMSVAKKDIEERIQRLTQKSRAAGIHLVISTQRPSVDVITGVIKGNLPTRMALRVIQEVDSRTIIDETGAQKLLGNGDMLYRTEGMFNCQRLQGAFLSSKEVEKIVAFVKTHNEAYFDTEISDYINNPGQTGGSSAGDDGGDDGGEVGEQYIKALGIVVRLGTASISLIQRKCSVGYNHAGKIMEWMELMGYVSPYDGKAKARTVILTKEEYESKYGSLD